MKNSRLGQKEGNFSLHNVILWKLVYPLLATTFTQEQCRKIMSLILTQGLPLAGFLHCTGTWATKILQCKYLKPLYQTNSCTHQHFIEIFQPTTRSDRISSLIDGQSHVSQGRINRTDIQRTTDITGSNYGDLDETYLACHQTGWYSPCDRYPGFPITLARRQRDCPHLLATWL